MFRSHVSQVAVVTACVVGLVACGSSSQSGQPVASTSSPSANTSAEAGHRYQASLALQGQPEVSPDGNDIVVAVRVTNTGTGIFGSETKPNAVNLGAHSIDAAGTIMNNDLKHSELPQVAPGATVTTTIKMPAGQLLGKRAEILPVEENVSWFDAWGTKPLVVGPFEACSGKVCDASGKPLPVAPAQ